MSDPGLPPPESMFTCAASFGTASWLLLDLVSFTDSGLAGMSFRKGQPTQTMNVEISKHVAHDQYPT